MCVLCAECSEGPYSLLCAARRAGADGTRLRVLVRALRHVRSVLCGRLLAFDKLFNLVLFAFWLIGFSIVRCISNKFAFTQMFTLAVICE